MTMSQIERLPTYVCSVLKVFCLEELSIILHIYAKPASLSFFDKNCGNKKN